ncbi:MAG: hypothetical protein IRZ15_05535 [Bryobacteraceae bacterium]|nr:hypothetical protein [Bryobacteraceae bacterium]
MVEGDAIKITGRFWPYQKRAAFPAPACVRSVFTAADEKLAVALYQRGVSIKQLEPAIWLGCARKYTAALNRQTYQAIISLAYFDTLIDEVMQTDVPDAYWKYVRRKADQLEQDWLETWQAPRTGDQPETRQYPVGPLAPGCPPITGIAPHPGGMLEHGNETMETK